MGNIPPMAQLNRKLSVQVKLAISALALGNLLALPIIAPATNGSDEANSQFVCSRNESDFREKGDVARYIAPAFNPGATVEFMNPPGGQVNCSTCGPKFHSGTQSWCQSRFPDKCWDAIIFPEWEYLRKRTRDYFACSDATRVSCGPWSPIAGSACCGGGGKPKPQCGDLNTSPPVTLPECVLAGE